MRSPTSFITALTLILAAGSTCLAIDTPEVEGNETKATATVVPAMAPGDSISGTCTGSTTTVGALNSLDTWDITTTGAGTPGIYEYRLDINETTSTGRTMFIRGLNQSAGVIGATDSIVQQANPTNVHFVKWYANEQPSRIYLRLTGTTSTTNPYTVTLSRTLMTPDAVPNPVDAGPVVITTSGQTSSNTEMWLYDGNLNAITDAGNDNETVVGGAPSASNQSRLHRTLSPGNYLLAISTSNLANHLASPADDGNRAGNVMDFPNAICCSVTTGTADLDFTIGNRCNGISQPMTMTAQQMDVKFVSFTVAGTQLPDAVVFAAGAAAPANVGQGLTTLLTVTATGGAPTAVTGDLAAFGLTSAEAFHDDGVNGDVAGGDGIWSYALTVPAGQATGAHTVNVSGTVANACVPPSRSIALTVNPANDLCANALPIVVGGSYLGTTLGGTSTGDPTASCGSISPQGQGVWYSFTETNPTGRILRAHLCDPVTNFDAKMFSYSGSCGALTCLSGNDVSPFGCPIQDESQVAASSGSVTKTPTAGFGCTVPGTTYYILVANTTSNAGGNFVLHLEEEATTPCGGLPSTNNFCTGARPVTTVPFWETVRRPLSLDNLDVSCNEAANTVARGGVWYTFTPSQNGDLYHTQVHAQTGGNDTVLTIYTGPDCSTLTEFACIDAVENYTAALPHAFRAPVAQLTAGTTYWMLVSQFSATVAVGGNTTVGFNFIPTTPTCPGNLCGGQDYNGDGDFGTDQDIEAFFACLGGNCCATCFCQASDFNGDGDFGTDADIEAFFRVLGGGNC